MTSRRWLILLGLALVGPRASAQPSSPPPSSGGAAPSRSGSTQAPRSGVPEADPFAAAASADPLELARLVDRLGDDAVLTRLSEGQLGAVRLAAAQACPFMREPELALPALAELAAGRDPYLAPAAAAALVAIARALDLDSLGDREVDPASLAPVRARLVALGEDASARADIRAAARLAASCLEALDVGRPR